MQLTGSQALCSRQLAKVSKSGPEESAIGNVRPEEGGIVLPVILGRAERSWAPNVTNMLKA